MSNKEMLELLHNPANFLRYLEKKGGVGLPQVQFWIDVEEYKALPNEQRKEKGILIYSNLNKFPFFF